MLKLLLELIFEQKSVDGQYEVNMALTRALVDYTGTVNWEPPAIYKSSYILNVEFYPFDQQECGMKVKRTHKNMIF